MLNEVKHLAVVHRSSRPFAPLRVTHSPQV